MSSAGRTRGGLGNWLSGLAVAAGCVLFLGGFAWGAVLYRPYTVPTDSMTPTVDPGDRVLARRIDGSEVRRGDVVVFRDSVWGNLPVIKRVVGIGGDEVACCDEQGRLTVNGTPIDEPYLRGGQPASPDRFGASVPEGKLFLLGDHRSTSQDSRVHLTDSDHGAVPRQAVDARVEATVWPPADSGMLARATSFGQLSGGISRPGPLPLIAVGTAAGAVLILGGAAYGPVAHRVSQRRKARVDARAVAGA